MADSIIVGIDLGTTNTCVSYYYNGKIKVLENKEGDRVTPSFVFFMENTRTIVGKYAKKLADSKPEYGVYEVKRLIGRQFDDLHVQNNLGYFCYQVSKDNDSNSLKITIDNKKEIIKRTPQEVSAVILKKIKQDIDTKLGQNILKTVITVPAYFNIVQREATLEAAKLAGFEVLKLLNEPTASALSYFYENNNNNTNYAMVYDLGGGTFDVAILKRAKNQIDIIGVDGDTHLGGRDFDKLLVDYVCDILQNKHKYNPRNNNVNMRRLMNECEEAKKMLSTTEETSFTLIGFVDQPIDIVLTRQQFETQADEQFQQTITIMDRCLKHSKLNKNDINEIILAGGSTRIPKIQQLISEYFDGKDLNQFVHPDECVAEGAALQAAMFSTNNQQKINEFTINDVTRLTLGLGGFVGIMQMMIPKNSPIPISVSRQFVTTYDRQTAMKFSVYEGERCDVDKNHYLGRFVIRNITPGPPGLSKITATMSIDQNGILTITAYEKLTGNKNDLKIAYIKSIDTENEAICYESDPVEDQIFIRMAKSKGYLIMYCISIKYNLDFKDLKNKYQHIYDHCDKTLRAVECLTTGDEEFLTQLTNRTQTICEEIVGTYNFDLMPKQIY